MPRKRSRISRMARARLRRLLRRLDRHTPDWMQWLTPWGTSLALHALLLLVFGIVLYVRSRVGREPEPAIDTRFAGVAQLTDDLTSLGRLSDRAGDPFTSLESDDPPSLDLDPARTDALLTNVPELPPSFRLGAEIQVMPPGPADARPGPGIPAPPEPKAAASPGKARARARSGAGGASGDGADERVAPFSGRQGAAKARLLRREGGTRESEKAVERGLDWLARHQRRDGSWGLDTSGQCKGQGCPESPFGVSDTAATGLALLPMLGAGHVHTEKGRYRDAISRGLHWLRKHQRAGGELFTGGGDHTGMYSHAIATMALCEAYGMTQDPALREPARLGLGYIITTQNKLDGGWRYVPGQEGDTSVLGWQLFALRSGRMAGIGVPKGTIRRCRTYLDLAATDPTRSLYAYKPGRAVSPSMTAEALVARQILGWPKDHPALAKGVAAVAAHLEESDQRNTYYWYYATQLLHNMHGKEWPRWNRRVRQGLIALQADGEGCDRGSWDPSYPQPDFWLQRGGRLAVTSLSLLTLEVYYRYLPMYREPGDELDDAGPEPPAARDR